MTTETIKIHGMSALLDTVRSLPIKLQQQLERRTVKRALQPVLDSAVQKVPVGETGKLADSLKLRTRTKKGIIQGEVVALAPHAHLVEYGHRLVKGTKVIGFVGSSPPGGFLRPALDENAREVLKIVGEEIEAGLKKLETKK